MDSPNDMLSLSVMVMTYIDCLQIKIIQKWKMPPKGIHLVVSDADL